MAEPDIEEREWGGDFDILEDPEEKRVLFAALDSFYQYRQRAHYHVTHVRRQAFYALPSAHWQLLAQPPISYLETLDAVDDAIDANADIAEQILSSGLQSLGLPLEPPPPSHSGSRHPLDWRGSASAHGLDKARTIIRQLYRDWSAEGASERDAHFTPVLDALQAEFPATGSRHAVPVLFPGAGLGRLLHGACAAGFDATGNEISHHALLASAWVLNHTAPGIQHPLYPFALTFANHVSRAAHLRRVLVPDVHPGTSLLEAASASADESQQQHHHHPFERMSMAAGDFVGVYGAPAAAGSFAAVCTVFFLDTAPNPLRYMETVANCLRPGGVWINLGPLLWHFDPDEEAGQRRGGAESTAPGPAHPGVHEPGSVELTDDEVRALVERSGFVVEEHELREGAPAGYIADVASMLQNTYRVSFWVARRR